MKMKILPLIVAVAAGAMALTLVTTGQAGKSDIFGSDHDVGSPGNPTCASCHIPHKAKGTYLWAKVPASAYAADSDIMPLCFSCHDNTVAAGGYIPDTGHNHPQGVVMYDPDHNPATNNSYPITEHARYETSCKKCMEPDCGKCHDAHSGAWVFLDTDRFTPQDYDGDTVNEEFMNASICSWCHEGRRHGVDTWVLVAAVGPAETGAQCDNSSDDDGDTVVNDGCPSYYVPVPHTTHPEMIAEPDGAADYTPPGTADTSWWGDNADFEGTRLWSDDTTYANSPADDTQPYVASPGDIRCMSCHTPHGGDSEELTAMEASTATDSHAPICENCHE